MRRITTVFEAADDQLLSTLANVKIDLGISGTSEDTYLTRLISSASADAARYCSRIFKQETVDDRFFVNGCHDHLILSRYPVASITSVSVDGVTVDAAEYTFEPESGFMYRLDADTGYLSAWESGITVVRFIAGYEEIPSDLEGACIAMVKGRRASRKRDPSIKAERIPDVIDVTYWVPGPNDSEMPPDIRGILDRYSSVNV